LTDRIVEGHNESMAISKRSAKRAMSGLKRLLPIIQQQKTRDVSETWLQMQLAYDLAKARKNEHRIKIRRYRPKEVHALQ
jgi:hypothetical protein